MPKKTIMCHPVQLELEKAERGVREHARLKINRRILGKD